MITIKSVGGDTLYVSETAADVRAAVVEALKAGSDLSGSNLRGSDLSGSNLSGSNLSGSNLSGSNLRWSNLSGSDLSGSNLRGSNLRGSNLSDLKNAELVIAQTVICPAGDIIGWKKCDGDVIAQLLIPADAQRSNGTGRKCRADKAIVTALTDADDSPVETAASQHDQKFVYRVGETVVPTEPFDPDRWNECAPGIHFYLTREEAQAW